MLIHVGEPRLGGFLVVLSVQHPLIADLDVVLEIDQEVVVADLAASKKVLLHPIARVPDLEGVGKSVICNM